jgi:hypothetical protein
MAGPGVGGGGGGGPGAGGADRGQIDFIRDLNKHMQGLSEATKILEANFVSQTQALKELCAAMQCLKDPQIINSLTQINTLLGSLQGAAGAAGGSLNRIDSRRIRDLSTHVDRTNRSTRNLSGELPKLEKKSRMANVAMGAGIGAVNGFSAALKMMAAQARLAGSIISGLGGFIFNVAKALISIPLQIFRKIVDEADKANEGIEALWESAQKMRKAFGTLGGPTNTAIQGTAKAMNQLKIEGTSAAAVFSASHNPMVQLADMQNHLIELYEQSGPALRGFASEIEKTNGAAVAMQKGLGLTNEQMEIMAQRAKASGEGITDSLVDMTKQADHMARAYKLDAKVISREMGKASQDFKHFGNISKKELAAAVAFSQKLGVSLEKITGLSDSFDTFDSASENVAKLNSVMGLNIDTMEIMKASTPDKKLEVLRKEFIKAGIDGSKMDHLTRKLVASSTGLGDAEIIAAFDMKKKNISLKEMQQESEKAAKKTMTQEEALTKLADAMERLQKPRTGLTGGGGMLGAFLNGISEGMRLSPQFQKLMQRTMTTIRNVFESGKSLGYKLGEIFGSIMNSIGDMITKIAPLFKAIASEITSFLTIFNAGGKADFGAVLERIYKKFWAFFDAESQEGKGLLSGVKKLFLLFVKVIGDSIPWIMGKIAELARTLADFIRDPKKYLDKVGGTGGGGQFIEILKESFAKIKEVLPELKAALIELFVEAFKRLDEAWPYIWPVLLWWLKGALLRIAWSTLAGALWGALKSMVLGAFEGFASGGLLTTAKNLLSKFFNSIFGKAFIVAIIADAAINVSKSINKFSDDLQAQGFDPATAKIAAGTTGLINTLTFGLLPEGLQAQIATGIAKIADELFKAVDQWFGPGFSDSMKNYMSGYLDVFSGFGDLLVAMWNGDSQGVNDALSKMVNGLFDMWIGQFEMYANILLKIGPIILEYLYKALGWISNKIGDIFLSLKDLPLVGPIFEWVGEAFKTLGQFFTEAGEAWGQIADIMKQVNITKYIDETITKIKEFFTSTAEGASEAWARFTMPIRLAYYTIKTVIEAIYEEIIAPIASWINQNVIQPIISFLVTVKNIAMGIFNALWNNIIKPVFDFIIEGATKIYDAISSAFKKAWQAVEPIFNYIKEGFQKVSDWIYEKGEALITILSDPHTKAWDRIKKAYGYLKEEVSKLPGKIGEWFSGLGDKLKKPWEDSVAYFNENFTWEKFKEVAKGVIDGFIDSFKKIPEAIRNAAKEMIDVFKDETETKSPSRVFQRLGKGINDGLMSEVDKMPDLVGGSAEQIIESTKDALGIHSPSDDFQLIGQALADGMMLPMDGIPDELKKVFHAMGVDSDKFAKADAEKKKAIFTDVIGEMQKMQQDPKYSLKVGESLNLSEADMKRVAGQFESYSKGLASHINNLGLGKNDALEVANPLSKKPKKVETKGLGAAAGAITDGVGSQVLGAVKTTEEMVAAAQRIEKALEAGQKLNIDAKLQAFATKFGKSLGKGGAYTVKAKDVNIHVNFRIALDSSELERIMVSNGKSVIKQRINLLLDAVSGDAQKTDSAKQYLSSAALYSAGTPTDQGQYDN